MKLPLWALSGLDSPLNISKLDISKSHCWLHSYTSPPVLDTITKWVPALECSVVQFPARRFFHLAGKCLCIPRVQEGKELVTNPALQQGYVTHNIQHECTLAHQAKRKTFHKQWNDSQLNTEIPGLTEIYTNITSIIKWYSQLLMSQSITKLQLAITVTYDVNQMRFPHRPDFLEKLSVKEAKHRKNMTFSVVILLFCWKKKSNWQPAHHDKINESFKVSCCCTTAIRDIKNYYMFITVEKLTAIITCSTHITSV